MLVKILLYSRYDHYAVMCELLPAGVPSLVLCLAQWQARMFSHELHKSVSRSIGYPEGQVVPLVPYPPQ
jgi:hypothetical protein